MINSGIFLGIENGLLKVIEKSFNKELSKMLSKVAVSTDSVTTYRNLLRVLEDWDTRPFISSIKDKVLYYTYTSLLFGASQCSGNPALTAINLLGGGDVLVELSRTQLQSIAHLKESLITSVNTKIKKLLEIESEAREKINIQLAEESRERVVKELQTFLKKNGETYYNIAGATHASRVSAYGFTSEARALGITEYKINEQLDNRTCPICREQHGKVFSVSDARATLDVVARTTDWDTIKQVQTPITHKDVNSLRELSKEDMVNKGWHIPPFHPRCRGLLARSDVKEIPATEIIIDDSKSPLSQMVSGNIIQSLPIESSKKIIKDEFAQLGLDTSKKAIDIWVKELGVSPSTILADLLSISAQDYLNQITMGGLSSVGILKMGLTKTALKIETHGRFGQDLTTLGFRNRSIKSTMGKAISGNELLAQEYLRSRYKTALDTSMNKLFIDFENTSLPNMLLKGFTLRNTKDLTSLVDKISMQSIAQGLSKPKISKFKSSIKKLKFHDNQGILQAIGELGISNSALISDWLGVLNFRREDSMASFLSYLVGEWTN